MITPTDKQFSISEHELLAGLILKRFGWDLASAAAAWRRMLQNTCTDAQFEKLATGRRGELARVIVAWNATGGFQPVIPPTDWLSAITWHEGSSINGTSLRGYLTGKFPEMQAKLQAMSGQTGDVDLDGKVTVQFIGVLNGEPFTIYDYRGEREPLHIGGSDALDLKTLRISLASVGVVVSEDDRWR